VLLVSTLAQPAEARHLDLAAGVFSPLNNIDLSEDGFDLEVDLDTGGAFAVQGGYALDRWFDFTAGLHSGTHFDTYDESVNVFAFTAGGRFFPLPMTSRFRPWLGAQVGWYGVDAYLDDFDYFGGHDDDLDEFDDSFGFNAGGGFDFPINPFVSLGIDVRYRNAFDAFVGSVRQHHVQREPLVRLRQSRAPLGYRRTPTRRGTGYWGRP
jgi:hypothetical protein